MVTQQKNINQKLHLIKSIVNKNFCASHFFIQKFLLAERSKKEKVVSRQMNLF